MGKRCVKQMSAPFPTLPSFIAKVVCCIAGRSCHILVCLPPPSSPIPLRSRPPHICLATWTREQSTTTDVLSRIYTWRWMLDWFGVLCYPSRTVRLPNRPPPSAIWKPAKYTFVCSLDRSERSATKNSNGTGCAVLGANIFAGQLTLFLLFPS